MSAREHRGDEAWIRKLIEEDEGEIIKRGDLEGCVALYHDDAVLMWPDVLPIAGKDAIRSWYSDNIFDRFDYLDLDIAVREVQVADPWAYVWSMSRGTVRTKPEGAEHEFASKDILILRRQADGGWKFWREMLNMNPVSGQEQEPT